MAISDNYADQTEDVVQARLLDNVDDSIDKREGSVVYDLTRPASIEFAQVYNALDDVLTFGFASSDMPDNYLDLRVGEMGLTRKPAVAAVGELTFTYASEGAVIPTGTRCSTDAVAPIYFVTTTDGTVSGGTVTVAAAAETTGASGNVAAGTVTIVLGDLAGVATVTNAQAFDGGADVESSDSLLARYYDRVQQPATSGNANDYKQWAKSVAGVGDAKVYPIWNGNGTVKVVLLDEDKTAPPQATVDSVASYIESVRPIGATVTVLGATELAVDVSATLTLSSDVTLAQVTSDFTTALTDYLATLAFVDPTLRYAKIASLLIDVNGVEDYASLTVNGGTTNITVADGSVAVTGTVTFS
jgi:uncharacterized phage protein gp47/JayE